MTISTHTMDFFELRRRPGPNGHDRALLTYADDLDEARAQATRPP